MRRAFYSRLAATNIQKNRQIYLPYLLAGSLMVGLYYVLSSVKTLVSESGMEGGGSLGYILLLSEIICGILSVVVLFYINSFVMKRRRREFGLYSVLGLEKRHLSLVVLWEVFFSGGVCIAGGIAGGALLSWLMFLLLLRVAGLPAQLTFRIPLGAVAVTTSLFLTGFALVLAYDVLVILRTDPIALLHSAKKGEREPKARWAVAALGALALGAGYAMALTVKTPSDALGVFFFAVLLVIAGTYCLFMAGSIALLKLLRRNKGFYYRPQNFISVSGMIYRMKQNAAGLANICILATCVLVTLSSTICLFAGEEDILRERYPRQVHVSSALQRDSGQRVAQAVGSHAREHGFTVENAVGYASFAFAAVRQGDGFSMRDTGDIYRVECVALEDYNRAAVEEKALGPGEALVYIYGDPLQGQTVSLGDIPYAVKEQIPVPGFLEQAEVQHRLVAVLPGTADLEALAQAYGEAGNKVPRRVWYDYSYDLRGEKENLPAYYATLRDALGASVQHLGTVESIDLSRSSFYELYGSLLFVGIFFVALFLIATVLIIYYKQITEGYDDRERFQIMEKVGMSDREVRATIQKQVLMVFFLPLALAFVHIAVAFPVLLKLLTVFSMTDAGLFLLCVASTALAFAALYFAIYQITARAYYRIVQGRA